MREVPGMVWYGMVPVPVPRILDPGYYSYQVPVSIPVEELPGLVPG